MGFCKVEEEGIPPGKLQFHEVIASPFDVVLRSVKLATPAQLPVEEKLGVMDIGVGINTILKSHPFGG